MFSRVVAAAVASVAFSVAANAADIPARRPVPALVTPAPVWSWEGFYVGIHGGYASGDADVRLGATTASSSPKGGFGGVQVGYNYLFTPRFLLGYEMDASFGDINDNTSPLSPSNLKVNTFGTLRGRLGYVQGPWLLYGTFGTAWARTEWSVPAFPLRTDRTHVGWTGGVGVEYAFSRNWSAKAEYLYADFGDTRRTVGATAANTDVNMSTFRLGLNYHFGTFGDVTPTSALPVKAPVRVAAWTGPYIGLHGGYGSGDFRASVGGASTNLDPDGGFGGIQGGYNWQFAPNWVFGLEGDSSWGSLKDTSGATKVEIDSMGTGRGRLGYAFNNLLLYGTGGLAYAHVKSTATGPATSDHYMLGWTAGAGLEYQFMPRWSAKIEYAYMDFGDVSETVGVTGLHDKLDAHMVKVGLNYQASLLSLFSR